MNRPLLLVLLLATAACAQDTSRYPSLALRPIETRPEEEPEAAPRPVAADAALDVQLATMAAAARRNAIDFAAAAAKADSAASAIGARTTGSDAWLAAQGALADLEALHGDLLGVMSDYDRLGTDRGEAGAPAYPSLDTAQAAARVELDAQTARIAAVRAKLGD